MLTNQPCAYDYGFDFSHTHSERFRPSVCAYLPSFDRIPRLEKSQMTLCGKRRGWVSLLWRRRTKLAGLYKVPAASEALAHHLGHPLCRVSPIGEGECELSL